MGRGSQGQGQSAGGLGGYGQQMSQMQGQVQDTANQMRGQVQGIRDQAQQFRQSLPTMQNHPFQGGPQGNFPGADGGMTSQPWGDIDWMKLREQFNTAGGQGAGGGWMEALKNRNQAGSGQPHMNGMTQAMSQARNFAPSGSAAGAGFRPQGINPITTAGSVAGTQQAPTSSIETGVTPQSTTAGAQPAPSGPPPAAPTGVAPQPSQPSGGGANAQALIQALRARR